MKKLSILLATILTICFTSCSKEKVIINNANDLNGKKIGVQSGTTGENWVQTNLKDIRLSSFKTGTTLVTLALKSSTETGNPSSSKTLPSIL